MTATTVDHRQMRARFDGVAQIVAFNWPRYATGAFVVCGLLATIVLASLPAPFVMSASVAAGVASWWMLASLAASHWVYDRSGLYELRWLSEDLRHAHRWANIHAGLDGFSRQLEIVLECEPAAVIDIYDASQMTERSIARARRERVPHTREVAASHAAIPLGDATCDAVFLLFAAHELRTPDARLSLFRECRRSLAPGGAVIVAEHLRDAANAAAFGPGFMHFFARSRWLAAFDAAGLRIDREFTHTLFVRVFVLKAKP